MALGLNEVGGHSFLVEKFEGSGVRSSGVNGFPFFQQWCPTCGSGPPEPPNYEPPNSSTFQQPQQFPMNLPPMGIQIDAAH